jgi:hypothetical protein
MSQEFRTDPQLIGLGYPILGLNSQQLSKVDGVSIDTSGRLILATNSSRIHGFSNDDRTMTSDNETVAKVCPQYVPAFDTEIFITADQAVVQTQVGDYVVYAVVTTGIQTVSASTSSATVGQFEVLGFDPYKDGTTTLAVVAPARFQALAYAPS